MKKRKFLETKYVYLSFPSRIKHCERKSGLTLASFQMGYKNGNKNKAREKRGNPDVRMSSDLQAT